MKHKGIIIIGGQAGSKIVYDIFALRGETVMGFANNYVKLGDWRNFMPKLLGSVEDQSNQELLRQSHVEYFVATGDNYEREGVTKFVFGLTRKLPENAIHPAATISPLAQLGSGNLINAGAVINAFASVGNGTIINTGAIVEHDNRIGDYAQISSGVVLAGYVTIEEYAFVGSGASVIPHVIIGKGAIVGAGSVVLKDVEPYTLVAGVPARYKKDIGKKSG